MAVNVGHHRAHDREQAGRQFAADALEQNGRDDEAGNAAGCDQRDEADRFHDGEATLGQQYREPGSQSVIAEQREEPEREGHDRTPEIDALEQGHERVVVLLGLVAVGARLRQLADALRDFQFDPNHHRVGLIISALVGEPAW